MKTIVLTRGDMVAIVSDKDYERVMQFKWWPIMATHSLTWYAQAWLPETKKFFYMHRYILGLTDPRILVDHKDLNGLNNCRSNIRIATGTENQANKIKCRTRAGRPLTSKYKGVSLHADGKWVAQIKRDGIVRHLGLFTSEREAAEVYASAAILAHGRFARFGARPDLLNQPSK